MRIQTHSTWFRLKTLADGLWSTIVTNIRAFGVQNIIMPKGSDISEVDLMGNMNLITYDPAYGGKPESLDLCHVPADVYHALELFEQKKNQISGVNSTAQGAPPAGVTAGVAISMLQSLNVQYSQGAQGSYINIMTSIGTALLNILKENAKTERLMEFTGKASKSLLQKFTGEDISSISRVIAKPGNPLSQTIQGRFAIAEMMLQQGMVQDGAELLEVLQTGSLDVITEGAEMQSIYAQQENELLRDGQNVQVNPLDDHISHLRKHISLISDISVRSGDTKVSVDPATAKTVSQTDPNSNPEGQKIMHVVMQHMMEHIQHAKDPNIASIMQMLGYKTGEPPQQGQGGGGGAQQPQAAAGGGQQPHAPPQLGPSPKNGVRPAPQNAQQSAATAAVAGNSTENLGSVPGSAIKQAQGK